MYAHNCRLVRKRCGVCSSATSKAARMGPIAGICRSSFTAGYLRLSTSVPDELADVTQPMHRTAGSRIPPDGAPRLLRVSPAILSGDEAHKPAGQHRESPNSGRLLSPESSLW